MSNSNNNSSGSGDDEERATSVGSVLFVCLAASIIAFASAADECDSADVCDDEHYAWAIACGVISALICFVRLGLLYQKVSLDAKVDIVLALLLLVLWCFGAAFNTSTEGPFSATKNGYFATWIAFLASAMYAAKALPMAYERIRTKLATVNTGLLVLLFTSLVEMSVAADVCDNVPECEDRVAFAVAVGAISSVVCIIQLILLRRDTSLSQPMLKISSVFLVLWWAVGAGLNTSAEGPFNSSCGGTRGAANGYFSTWAAFFSSLYLCFQVFHPTMPDSE